MRTQRALGLLSLTTIGLLSAAAAQADIVTYRASGAIDQIDNPANLPGSLSGASAGQILSIDFTINTNTIGSANGPGDTSYLGAVLGERASIGAGAPVTMGFDFSTVEITNNTLTSGTYSSGFQLISLGTPAAGFTGTTSAFAFLTGAGSSTPLNFYNDTALSNAPLNPSQANAIDSLAIVFTNYVDGVEQSYSDAFVSTDVSIANVSAVAAPEIDSASSAGALTLLLGSLAVLLGRRSGASVSRLG